MVQKKRSRKSSAKVAGQTKSSSTKLVQAMTAKQKKIVEDYIIEKGAVRGTAQYGGFLGMLASIGMAIAIDLISKIFSKGLPCLY